MTNKTISIVLFIFFVEGCFHHMDEDIFNLTTLSVAKTGSNIKGIGFSFKNNSQVSYTQDSLTLPELRLATIIDGFGNAVGTQLIASSSIGIGRFHLYAVDTSVSSARQDFDQLSYYPADSTFESVTADTIKLNQIWVVEFASHTKTKLLIYDVPITQVDTINGVINYSSTVQIQYTYNQIPYSVGF